ncbi:MAG: aminotransferase class V-fold PLP-dependent enzyme [Actinobacteria bacterium]|nr:aminotransferase class V-fold PLP-dependent enzyme [Actinomycetota bacterium]
MLDPSLAYLNHGTVGATPRRVMAEYRHIQDSIERQPAQFQLRDLADVEGSGDPARPYMRVAAEGVARHLGCRPDDLAFVDNATTGVNAVLRSFPFERGDEILVTSLGYGAVTSAARWVAERHGGAVRTVDLPPYDAPAADYVRLVDEAVGPRTRIVLVDHITSQTALVLPLAGIAAACRRKGALVLVDAAHSPGAIDVDIESYGVDLFGPMVNVGLPRRFGTTKPEAVALQKRLLADHGIEIPVFGDPDGLRMRISAQIYNDASDMERLVSALRSLGA